MGSGHQYPSVQPSNRRHCKSLGVRRRSDLCFRGLVVPDPKVMYNFLHDVHVHILPADLNG